MSRPRADLAERRDAVLRTIRDAAIAEFARDGLHGASTQAIADRAGLTKARLHYYIRSKDALYTDTLRHIMQVWAELFHGLDTHAPPDVFLRAYITRKLRHALDHPDVARMYTGEVMRGAPHLRPLWHEARAATQAAAQVIDGWIARGLIRPVDPVLLQFNIWSLTQHYALHAAEARFMLGMPDDAALDPAALADALCALVLGGLRP